MNIWFKMPSGAKMSVAVGYGLYSTPREDNASEYTHVEIGFPTGNIPESWANYKDGSEEDSKTVFGYVPVEIMGEWFKLNS